MEELCITNNFSMYYPEDYARQDLYATKLFENNRYHGVDILNFVNFKDAILIDAGAYVGWFTEWAIRQGVSTAVAFEPEMENFECLRRNSYCCNWYKRASIELFPFALHDHTRTLYIDGGGQQAVTGEEDFGGYTNTIGVPLDLMFSRDRSFNPNSHIILKMDIEGNEKYALVGASQLIQNHKKVTIIACVYHYKNQCAELKNIIKDLYLNDILGKHVVVSAGEINDNTALLFLRKGK